MKRIIIAVVVLVAVGAASFPFINGLLMEKVVKQSFQDANNLYSDSGSDISIQIIDYRRGYSTSEIDWKIDFGSLKAAYGINEILFTDHARHGIMGIVSETSLMKNSWYADFVNNRLGGKDPLHISTSYSISGDIESDVTLSSFSFQEEEETIEVKPARMVVGCDAGLKNFKLDSTFDGVGVAGKLGLEQLALKGEMERISRYIWDGKITTTLGSTTVEDQDGQLTLTNLAADYSLDYDDAKQKLDIAMTYGADKLTVNGNEIGKTKVVFAVNNLDSKGYDEFMQLYTKTMQELFKDLPQLENGNTETIQKELQNKMASILLQMMAAYEKLLNKDLQIKISDLLVTLPEGQVTGNFSLELKKDITFTDLAPLLGQPKLALDIFNLKSEASLPKQLLGDDPNLLTPLFPGMQTGIFLEDGDMIKHSAETKDGKLLLNGQEVQL